MAENKCDDLAAMYQLLLSPGPVQDRVEAGAAGCGAALPSLSPIEVYTEAGGLGSAELRGASPRRMGWRGSGAL